MPKSIRKERIILKIKLLIPVLLITAVYANAEPLKICYEASLLFKIGESCIEYNVEDDILRMKSSQNTTGLIDIAHHMEQRTAADISLSPFKSIYMYFYEKSDRKSMTHLYFYKEKLLYSGNTFRYKDSRYKSFKKEFDMEGVLDPAAVVMFVQLYDLEEEGILKTFFDGKYIDITYKKAGEKDIRFDGEDYPCKVVEFQVPVKTSSLVTPTGVWRIYIDKETGVIMRLELQFPLGNAKLKTVSITGDRDLLKSYIGKKTL
jgi:hypothetical protein